MLQIENGCFEDSELKLGLMNIQIFSGLMTNFDICPVSSADSNFIFVAACIQHSG
jgi:hypothetical protein